MTETLAPATEAGAALKSSAITPVLAEISNGGGPRTDGQFSAVAMLLIDSVLTGDEEALRELQEWLRNERAQRTSDDAEQKPELRGRLLGLIDASHWAIERVLPPSEVSRVERSSHANQFLKELAATPGLGNRELAALLAVDDTQVSRLGRTLRKHGLAASRQIGRRNRWELTPKGLRTLEVLNGVADTAQLSQRSVDDGSVGAVSENKPGSPSVETTPPASILAVLAKFFGTRPVADNDFAQWLEKWLPSMRDEAVRRIASRSAELSHEAKETIAANVDELLRKEHAHA